VSSASVLLAALSWEPQIKGALYVVLSVVVLCGSAYLLLSTNVGARLGFLLAGAGLFGWLATGGFIWWAYGRGPVGPLPTWTDAGVVVGSLAGAGDGPLRGFPEGWAQLPLDDTEVADAIPAGDEFLTHGDNAVFNSPTEYVLTAVYQRGGERHGPFNLLNFRPFNLWHRPNYLVLQVQPAVEEPNPAGGIPRMVADPNAPPVSALLLRDLGAVRLHPAVFTIATTIAFGLFCYQLHVRDKAAWARREAEAAEPGAGRLEPVSR
jgi:hypothetical protein